MTEAEINNRFDHHPPTDEDTVILHEYVRAQCKRLASELDLHLLDGREKALALTKLEEAMFWANAAVARQVVK
ncbi:Acb2/Tad1 domain-containing protein [Kitasatospora aureofaciens]|uniref:Acb2/Tad1 domain-containing protein n=1 Tax=Kitasatospora aureofaciens TaxID=1894 RepID=UPI0033E93468